MDGFNDYLNKLKEINDRKDKQIEYLQAELKKVKDEKFKDAQLKEMQETVERAKRELRQGFPISDAQNEKIVNWQQKHIRKKHWDPINNCECGAGACGGRFVYEFLPTGIGTFITCKCSCGEKFEIDDI